MLSKPIEGFTLGSSVPLQHKSTELPGAVKHMCLELSFGQWAFGLWSLELEAANVYIHKGPDLQAITRSVSTQVHSNIHIWQASRLLSQACLTAVLMQQ